MKSFQLTVSSKRQKIVNTSISDEINDSHNDDFGPVVLSTNTTFTGAVLNANVAEPRIIPLAKSNKNNLSALDLQAEQEIVNDITSQESDNNIVVISSIIEKQSHKPLLSSIGDSMNMNDNDRFHCELQNSADDVNFRSEIYNAVPVSEFGAAVLRGMGWQGEDMKPAKEEKMVARENRLGLGATAKPPSSSKSSKSSKHHTESAAARNIDTRVVNSRFNNGDIVYLLDKRYADRRGCLVQTSGVPGLDMIRVQLENDEDDEVVVVSRKNIALLTEKELLAMPYNHSKHNNSKSIQSITTSEISKSDTTSNKDKLTTTKSSKEQSRSSGSYDLSKSSSGSSGSSNNHNSNTKTLLPSSKSSSSNSAPISSGWLRSGIRVKCVSPSMSCYKLKGVVVDVVSRGVACVRMDRGDILSEVRERDLETVLPEVGMQCMVVLGEHTGEVAVLIEKHWDRNMVTIELIDDLQIVMLSMDNVAASVNI